MPRDEITIVDILEAADRLSSYISGMTRPQFVANHMARAAVVREIEIMGEAAKRLSSGFKDGHSSIPWRDLSRLRDIYIHAYDRINYDRVWRAATGIIPRVAEALRPFVYSETAEAADDET